MTECYTKNEAIMSTQKVVVAMSGGVDSSVAAALLVREGYDVVGITMRLWTEERDDLPMTNRTCCGVEVVDDAQAVAQALEFPYYVMNFEQPFARNVVDYFVNEYASGRTPNPCQACNQHVKFDHLLDKAVALGADYVATGHYARVRQDDAGYHLLKGADPGKDQSYFLHALGQEELRRVLLPVGEYTKPQIRDLAVQFDLPVADKPDSQEICFIPDNDYRRFISERVVSQPGEMVDTAGRVLGAHRGVASYTVGQRHGLGVASPERLYVTRIDAVDNRVVVGPEEHLYATEAIAEDVHFVLSAPASFPLKVNAKIRYKSREAAATLYPEPVGLRVVFDDPQRALTPGQSIVFYQAEELVGGGTIA